MPYRLGFLASVFHFGLFLPQLRLETFSLGTDFLVCRLGRSFLNLANTEKKEKKKVTRERERDEGEELAIKSNATQKSVHATTSTPNLFLSMMEGEH